eukprot:gnl/TRDRNA2_/TRDRNA2_177696_c3_seq8.p1 gnl/TRDRNA2_/TRDRNA2_177696_c3~~gnl/TRDRNA2_/TRDRNA2_177696_c3_seq8.p1  ORF type:complete len:710 (+),score=247.80 gnl/TRDRNA2_/TRDRNA2_177696_c3_seq8:64-2193(+)
MARFFILAFVLLACVARAEGSVQKVTPIEKVIELLKQLSAQTVEEGKAEAKQYDNFSCFCKEQASEKLYNIEKSTAKIERLTAKISDLDGEISKLNSEISDLSTKISDLEDEINKVQNKETEEHNEYVGDRQDITTAIHQVDDATNDMKHAADDEKGDVGGVNLMALKATAVKVLAVSSHLRHMAPSDKQLDTLKMLAEPGKAHGYEFHSNEIIETMEGVEKTEKKERTELDEDEFKLEAALEKKILALKTQKGFAEKERDEKSALEASKSDEMAAAKEDKASEIKSKKADNDFMDVLTEQCEQKAKEFDQRSQMRADELTAMSEALDSLEKGVKPNYDANKKLVGLAQRSATPKGHWAWVEDGPSASAKPASFIQLRKSSGTTARQVVQKVQELLQSKADILKNAQLSAVALKVKLSEDHFVKVRGLIKDLIAKLKADAEAEAEQKGFCDKNMADATSARDEAKMTIEAKTADTHKNEAEKAKLNEEISALQEAIAANKKGLNEATQLRNKEKADNKKTLTDAEAGKDAVKFAITTLKDFYEGASMIQTRYTPPAADRSGMTVSDMAPKAFSGTYHGNQAQSKGIIGMLEVILSDFERTLETVEATEDEAQKKFESFESETESDNEEKQEDVEKKESRISDIEDALVTLADEKSDGEKKLDGALEELEKLKSMCVEGGETYAERVAAREQEIAALKEAMQMLIDWQGF